MKRGMRPIANLRNEAMFQRVDVAIFDMAGVIRLVANQMLPKPTLPNAAFVARDTSGAELLPLRQNSYKPALDQAPACREITITWGEAPDCVQMIGQYHECVDLERTALACRSHGFARDLDMVDEQGLPPVQQVDCEEPTSAWNKRTTIIRHETQDSTDVRFVARRRITPSANPPYSPTSVYPASRSSRSCTTPCNRSSL